MKTSFMFRCFPFVLFVFFFSSRGLDYGASLGSRIIPVLVSFDVGNLRGASHPRPRGLAPNLRLLINTTRQHLSQGTHPPLTPPLHVACKLSTPPAQPGVGLGIHRHDLRHQSRRLGVRAVSFLPLSHSFLFFSSFIYSSSPPFRSV